MVVPVTDCGSVPVVVVGGGVGGCALGMMLARVHGLRVAVFEKDACFEARRQGYGITIQHHVALDVLGFQNTAREEDTVNDAHFIFEPDGTLVTAFGRFLDDVQARQPAPRWRGKHYNVHMPRQRLRELLVQGLNAIRPTVLQWGWALESFQHTADARVEVAQQTLCVIHAHTAPLIAFQG